MGGRQDKEERKEKQRAREGGREEEEEKGEGRGVKGNKEADDKWKWDEMGSESIGFGGGRATWLWREKVRRRKRRCDLSVKY